MYLRLIDTVSNIVQMHGIGIISDAKFWNILNDSFPFSTEHSLKECFRFCISKGYLREIANCGSSAKKALDTIQKTEKSVKGKSQFSSEDLRACLFSVAIACKSLSKKDYSKSANPSQTQPTPANPRTKPKHKNPNIKVNFGVIMLVMLGLVVLWGSTALYGTFLNPGLGWWISCITLLLLVAQAGYCALCLNMYDGLGLKWTKAEYATTTWSTLTIIGGFIISDCLPFFFCSQSIRNWLSYYFNHNFIPSTSSENVEAFYYNVVPPGGFGIFLNIILIFIVCSCWLGLFSPTMNLKKPRYKIQPITIKYTLAIMTFGYLIICLLPTFSRYQEGKAYYEGVAKIQAEIDSLRNYNLRLIQSRRNEEIDLSFKEYSIGATNIIPDSLLHESTIHIKDKSQVWKDFIGKSSYNISSYNQSNDWRQGKMDAVLEMQMQELSGSTTLDNMPVSYSVIFYGNKIVAIKIQYSGSTYSGNNETLETLLNLYTRKYGDPEIHKPLLYESFGDRNMRSYYSDYEWNNQQSWYQWSFKNGYIFLSSNGILYLSTSFQNQVKGELLTLQNQLDAKYRAFQDSVAAENARRNAEVKEAARQDSIRRALNHKNAINEI